MCQRLNGKEQHSDHSYPSFRLTMLIISPNPHVTILIENYKNFQQKLSNQQQEVFHLIFKLLLIFFA